MRMKNRIISSVFALTAVMAASAQVPVAGPELPAVILTATFMEKKQLEAQDFFMGLQTAGHIMTRRELDRVTETAEEFSRYLDSFNEILAFAAQTYSIYNEFCRTVKSTRELSSTLSDYPTNALAVAISGKYHQVYFDLITSAADIIDDVRQIFISDAKMTEADRITLLFGITPKLHALNKRIRYLCMVVRYTSMLDVWYEITDRAVPPADKEEIAARCMRNWGNRIRVVEVD